jgi:UDP-glucose 4-epimerase
MLKHLTDQVTKPKRVVILGSAGFIGNACTQRLRELDVPLLELPHTVLDLTALESGDLLADLLRPEDSLLFVALKHLLKRNLC